MVGSLFSISNYIKIHCDNNSLAKRSIDKLISIAYDPFSIWIFWKYISNDFLKFNIPISFFITYYNIFYLSAQFHQLILTLKCTNSFFFRSFFWTYPKIGSFRLPTHIVATLIGNFFDDPFLIKSEILPLRRI